MKSSYRPLCEYLLINGRFLTWFAWYRERSWNLRVLGVGIGCRPIEDPPLFSIRAGLTPAFTLWRCRFVFLKPLWLEKSC